jgi:hypothetical protein
MQIAEQTGGQHGIADAGGGDEKNVHGKGKSCCRCALRETRRMLHDNGAQTNRAAALGRSGLA